MLGIWTCPLLIAQGGLGAGDRSKEIWERVEGRPPPFPKEQVVPSGYLVISPHLAKTLILLGKTADNRSGCLNLHRISLTPQATHPQRQSRLVTGLWFSQKSIMVMSTQTFQNLDQD